MKQKLSVAEFAALVGTTSKTIYERIKKNGDLPLNEQLEIVNEKVKGREVLLIITDSDQINLYKDIYCKNNVIEGEYYETVTDNNSLKTFNNGNETVKTNYNNGSDNDLFERLSTLHNDYNNRLDTVRNELFSVQKQLMESEKRTLLLEDKANREGFYINEINQKEKDIKRQKKVINILITVSILLLIVIITFATYFITLNNVTNNVEKPVINSIEKVQEANENSL